MASNEGPPPRTSEEVPLYNAPFTSLRGEDGFDPTLLVSVSILLLALTLIILRLLKLQWDEAAARKRTAALLAMAQEDEANERRQANVAGGRRHNVQNRRRVNYGDDFLQRMMDDPAVDPEEMDDDVLRAGMGDEKIGAKKLAKLEAKAAKKAAREQEMIEREERKKREEEREKEREKEREREREAEEREAERLKREKEEREKRELEEYLKLKEQFDVQEEGFDEVEGEEAENLMKSFLDYVKECKVVNVDELAAHFSLKSEEAVNRLQYFLDEGQLTGLMDDRGKFIYVTKEEMEAVAKFINQRGRVTIAELSEYSSRLVKLEN